MHLSTLRSICVVTVQVAISVIAINSALAQEATRDLLAAQIRDQGYRCNKPVSVAARVERLK
jgi:hypothetical protein